MYRDGRMRRVPDSGSTSNSENMDAAIWKSLRTEEKKKCEYHEVLPHATGPGKTNRTHVKRVHGLGAKGNRNLRACLKCQGIDSGEWCVRDWIDTYINMKKQDRMPDAADVEFHDRVVQRGMIEHKGKHWKEAVKRERVVWKKSI